MAEIAKSRKEQLLACERVLVEHMEEFVKVGRALEEIRDKTLYDVEGFKTFEEYCRKKWDMSKRHANRLIVAADIRLRLPNLTDPDTGRDPVGPNSEPLVWNERQMREFARLGSPTRSKAVAQRVVKAVKEKRAKGEKVKLGSVVRKAVDEELGTARQRRSAAEMPEFQEVVAGYVGKVNGMADVIEGLSEDELRLFGKNHRHRAKELAEAIRRLQTAWDVTRAAGGNGK